MQLDPILRLRETCTARGRAPSTHWDDITKGLCTHQVRTGPRSVGWPASEIAALNKARIAGKSEDEIRALVKQLEARRQDETAESDPAQMTSEEIYLRKERAR